jgi:hypothetical protein
VAWLLAFALLGSGVLDLRASVVLEETHSLAAGWNLIHVAVEPLEKDPALALQGVNWESLWTWLPDAERSLVPTRGGRWLSLHRGQPDILSSLGTFTGPASYAVLASSAGTLRVKGTWRPDRQPLRGFAFQLFGPSVPGMLPPGMASYFSRPGVLEHLSGVHELAGGTYRRLLAGDTLRRGAAYWVLPTQDIPEPHPLRVITGFGGLQFSAQIPSQEIELDLGVTAAGSGEPRRLNLRVITAAGTTGPTDWLELQGADGSFTPLAAGATIEVEPGVAQVRLAFRARQEGLAAAGTAPLALAIEVSGATGSVLVGAELDPVVLKGIWTGEALLSEIELPTFHGGGGYAPAAGLPVALVLEVPEAGPARLLPCAQIIADRDGRQLNYRLSAALFPDAVPLSGTVTPDGKGGTLRGTATLGPTHPLNPYRHHYHPEHGQGFDVVRNVALRFGASLSQPGPENPLATVGAVAGVYEEELHGLSREPIRVRGTFRLRGFPAGQITPCSAAGQ